MQLLFGATAVVAHNTTGLAGVMAMHQNQDLFGDWEEISRLHSTELRGHRVEVRVLDAVHYSARAQIDLGRHVSSA